MWGNHLADRACVPDFTELNVLGDLRLLEYTVDETLQLFTKEDTMYWTQNGTPTLATFDSLLNERLLEDYERKRDDYRSLRTPPDAPKWSGPLRRSISYA